MSHCIFRGLLSGTGGGGGGGGGGFANADTTPPSLGGGTGCRLYVAAQHGLYTDAGSTLATTAGQSVYRWKDYSGNSNHLDQSNALSRPVAGSAAQLTFASTFLSGSTAIVSGVTDGELFLLLKSDVIPQPGINCGSWYFGGGNLGVYGSTDGNTYEGAGTSGRYSWTTVAGLTSWHVYSVRTSGTNWEALKDNSSIASTSSNTVDWGSVALTVGTSRGGGLYFYGQMAAVVFYAGARSAPERASIVAALLAQAPP